MKRNFRTRKITSRVTPISASQIEKLRNTRLAKSKSYKESRYLSSAQFDKKIRSDIRLNRLKLNQKLFEKISASVGKTRDDKKALLELLGEKTSISRKTGKTIRRNTFTSLKQTKRLKRIAKQVNDNKFNVKRYVARNKNYKKNRKFLPKNAGTSAILKTIIRTDFYYENKRDIETFNKIAGVKGRIHASNTRVGNRLEKAYDNYDNEETDSLFNAVLHKKG